MRNDSMDAVSAVVMVSSQNWRRSDGTIANPSQMPSRRPSCTARSMAIDHSTQASAARSWGWVSELMARAAAAVASSSPRWASSTGPVLMRLPLPAASG
ncbi:MAG TPA: hypothetical protein VND62_06660 [Acidimicrobiales bacterium]|nr:hypothetical protein [Acidimicrobiales bacterium]